MLQTNKLRVALWVALGAGIASITSLALAASSRGIATSAQSPTFPPRLHPTYFFRSTEECPPQRFLTETEMYEGARLMREFTDSIQTVPDTGYGDPLEIMRASEDDENEQFPPLTPEEIVNYQYDDDYSPAYYASIDPDGDHCENPVTDELMMVDWLSLGPGSTATNTSTTTTIAATSSTSSTVSTSVATTVPCTFSGFFSPVDDTPVINVVKAGAAVPVKFGFCESGSLQIFTSGSPSSTQHTCGVATTDDVESTVAASTSGLTFDAATRRYQYNWKTDKAWTGQCRTLSLRFTNGLTKTAEFRFR
jgi:hypothetical protein